MSVEFSNTYQEILLDNLVAIIKQNFIFQTQIKLAESSSKEHEEVKKKLEELTALYNNAKNDLSQLNIYKSKAESNSSAHEEKSRIQAALNDAMKKSTSLEKELSDKVNEINKLNEVKKQEVNKVVNEKNTEIDGLKNEIQDLKNYIASLEGITPVTKLKKLNTVKVISEEKDLSDIGVFEEKNDSTKIENNIKKVLDGSAF